MHSTRRYFLQGTLCTLTLLTACAHVPPEPASAAVRSALAPSGKLRIAVYPGSPMSMVVGGSPAEHRGVTLDIGREMARRLGVDAELVVLERAGQIVEALHAGQADMAITNATAARAALVDFSTPVVSLELGYLVTPDSPIQTMNDVDQPGLRIGVSEGSSSLASLSRSLKHAQLVTAPTLAAARAMLDNKQLDAFATNKGILFEMNKALPQARVLEGSWGMEHVALALPKGRDVAKPWVAQFVASVQREGLVNAAAQRAGLRGTVNDSVR